MVTKYLHDSVSKLNFYYNSIKETRRLRRMRRNIQRCIHKKNPNRKLLKGILDNIPFLESEASMEKLYVELESKE
jgi:hypothetical protein